MATLYCDLENGNDNYAGTSFAVLAQGTDGRITTATFSSATASFPNDGSLINQYLSIFNGTIYAVYQITAWVSSTSLTIAAISGGTALANQAVDRQYYIGGRWKSLTSGATAVRTIPGDTVRIMGSPAPTSLGQNGVWTSQALQATKSISSSSNATPITITCTAHGYSTGDTVVITGVVGNTNANGTWEITNTGANTFTLDGSTGNGSAGATGTVRLRNNTRVMLTSAVTQNIASTGPGRAAWTASANVSAQFSPGGVDKQHTNSDYILIGAAFTTGLAAYWPLPLALDLSGYQQLSFWVQMVSGTVPVPSGSLSLRLCSDVAGATSVNTFSLPAIPTLARWMPITVDLGTNLGTSIQSIALYVDTDRGAQEFYFSNIIACKASSAADSLTLTSLIGKNTTGETFWGIQSINGRRVMLDADTNATPTSTTVRGYYGTSETVTTWKRETIKLGPAAASTTALQTINDSGTDGSPITYSGGWDRTNMSTQSLETWLDGVNGNGRVFDGSSNISFIEISNIAATRCDCAASLGSSSRYLNLSFIALNNCGPTPFSTSAGPFSSSFTFGHIVACSSNGLNLAVTNSSTYRITYGLLSCAGAGISISSAGNIAKIVGGSGALVANNNGYAILLNTGSGATVVNIKTEGNASGGAASDISSANAFLVNCLIGETTEYLNASNWNPVQVFSQNHDQTANNHVIFMEGGRIASATDQRHTASGISWKLQPTNTSSRTSLRPVTLSLAKVACSANNLVTVKAWMRRDNSGLTMRLVCKGGQLAGVANDVTASVTTTNAWEELTITFTPTEAGVVEITAEAWGGTTFSGWVDDMTITQA